MLRRLISELFANNSSSGDEGLSFGVRLQSDLLPFKAAGSPTPTFTRATTKTGTDWEGRLFQAISGEAVFHGARRVANLCVKSEDLSVATGGWSVGTATVTSGISDPIGGTSAYTITANGAGSNWYRNANTAPANVAGNAVVTSIWLRRRTGTGAVAVYVSTADNDKTVTLTSSWQRFSVSRTSTDTNNYVGIYITTSGDEVDAWHPQSEVVTGQSNQNPSEYVSVGVLSAPYHGAGVDGVKYFTTTNGNTVASNVVTEAAGTAITDANSDYADAYGPFGYHAEGARTNRCLYSQVFSNAAWVSGGGGVAVTDNSAVAPDGTTTADTLTASGANGTLIQDLGVVASASKTGGLWLKRKTGTGNIDLTMDGGTGWTTVAVTSTWTRFSKNQTLADEDFGIRIVTSGDEVYAWQGQVETAAFLSTDIPTTTAAVTRNADALTYAASGNWGTSAASVYFEPRTNEIGFIGNQTMFDAGGSMKLDRYNATDVAFRGQGLNVDTTANMSDRTLYKFAMKSDGVNVDVFQDGAEKYTGASTGFVAATSIAVATQDTGALQLFGTIRNVRIYSRALSDARLQAMTTP